MPVWIALHQLLNDFYFAFSVGQFDSLVFLMHAVLYLHWEWRMVGMGVCGCVCGCVSGCVWVALTNAELHVITFSDSYIRQSLLSASYAAKQRLVDAFLWICFGAFLVFANRPGCLCAWTHVFIIFSNQMLFAPRYSQPSLLFVPEGEIYISIFL